MQHSWEEFRPGYQQARGMAVKQLVLYLLAIVAACLLWGYFIVFVGKALDLPSVLRFVCSGLGGGIIGLIGSVAITRRLKH